MRSTLLLACLVVVAAAVPVSAQEEAEEATPEILFALSGTSGSLDNDSLTLEGVPSVIYFGDRPSREVGHLRVADFVDRWATDEDLAANPPNAVLSTLDVDQVENAVLEITGVTLDGEVLRFEITTLAEGVPQGTFGPASLFVDPINNAGPWTGT